MKALVWHGGDRLAVEDMVEPDCRDDEVVFEVALAGICGSDLHPYRGHHGPRRPPLVLGHEAVGHVDGRPGRFALFPLVDCGECVPCRRGERQLCERRGLVGLDRPGVFAERVAVQEHALVPLPDEVDDRVAVLIEPLATSVSALRLEHVEPDDKVVVLGAGPIGLLAIHAARALGAEVVAVEPLPRRRTLAERLGAAETFATVDDLPLGRADVVLDAVGVEATWNGGIAAARPGGSVCVIGLAQAEGCVPIGELVRRGISLRGHYAYARADFEDALRLLASNAPPIDWLDDVELDDAAVLGFRRLVEAPDDVVKVILRVDGSGDGRWAVRR